MSEKRVIEKTIKLNTKESLIDDLKRLGVVEGDILLVHSSMSSLGWVCGEVQSVVQALLESVGEEGTIVMPAHTGSNSDPTDWCNPPVPKEWIEDIKNHMPAFTIDMPTAGVGRIPEYFRTYSNTLRSIHPHVSFSANGKAAKEIVKDHVLTPQLGMDTPLGKLYQMNSKILMIGTKYETCTSLHLSEVLSGCMPTCNASGAMMVDGKREWITYEDIEFDTEVFNALGEEYEKAGHSISINQVGMAKCRLIPMRELVDFGVEWIKKKRS